MPAQIIHHKPATGDDVAAVSTDQLQRALHQLRRNTSPAQARRRLGVGDDDPARRAAIIRKRNAALDVELEAGEGGVVADGRHDRPIWVKCMRKHTWHMEDGAFARRGLHSSCGRDVLLLHVDIAPTLPWGCVMPKNFSTDIKLDNIEFLGEGAVALSSNGLLNTFVHSSPHAIEKLTKEVTFISIDSVTIDKQGRIIIDDPKFVAALNSKIQERAVAGDTNYVCKNAYQCKPN
jgi:hypothetical protein